MGASGSTSHKPQASETGEQTGVGGLGDWQEEEVQLARGAAGESVELHVSYGTELDYHGAPTGRNGLG